MFSESSTRFELPFDIRQLEGTTVQCAYCVKLIHFYIAKGMNPIQYLSKHCIVRLVIEALHCKVSYRSIAL